MTTLADPTVINLIGEKMKAGTGRRGVSPLHPDEVEVPAGLVRALLRAQAPQWASLPDLRP